MDQPIVLQINKKQSHTQSPSALVAYFLPDTWGVSGTEELATPSLRVIYENDEARADAWRVKLVQLRHLRDGWNGYAAPAPSERAINTANSFVVTLLRAKYEPKRLAPSAVGGVGITQRSGNKKVYVEFFNDGKVFALFSDGHSEPISKEIVPGFQSFKALVKEMQEYLDA
jgi:hypothetical protein